MRLTYRTALVAGTLLAFSAGSVADPRDEAPPAAVEGPSAAVASAPAAVLLDRQDVEGVLGKEVRSNADENMGRIIDVVVDRMAQPRAVVIDFGGFLGVGSRKIAVEWSLLHFDAANDARTRITVELTVDQVRAAPEYKAAKPMVITSGLVNLESSSSAALSPN